MRTHSDISTTIQTNLCRRTAELQNAINFERSADMRLKVLRENNCDGAIIHINRSCKQWSGQMYELERVIREETGIPTAVFDGDQADPRNFSEAQYDTRIQGLVEVMAANKEAK